MDQFTNVINTAKTIVYSNRPDDQTFIIRFIDGANISEAQPLTSDTSKLFGALNALKIEGGETALIDAVYVSAEQLLKQPGVNRGVRQRKAMVLITDGDERSSFYKEEQLFTLLRKGDFRIFVIGLIKYVDKSEGFIKASARARATKLIDRLARETGGRAFLAEKPEDYVKAVFEITRDLHLQYIVRYRSANKPQADHKIEIKLNDKPDNKRTAILRPRYTTEQLGVLEGKKP